MRTHSGSPLNSSLIGIDYLLRNVFFFFRCFLIKYKTWKTYIDHFTPIKSIYEMTLKVKRLLPSLMPKHKK